MKRNLPTLILILMTIACGNICAQPVINSGVFGIAGDSYEMKGIDELSFEPGEGGADVLWDFSASEFSGGVETRQVVDAATSPYAADFPGANLATVTDDTSFTYYMITSAVFSLYGTATPTITQAFDDPAELADFPVTYLDTKTDDFTGSTVIFGFDVDLDGTATTTADGYGTIVLPGGIYRADALRIKVELDITGTVSGLPITAEINSIIYYWLIEGNLGPAIQYTHAETIIPGFTSTSSTYVDVSNALLIADGIHTIAPIGFTVTPNPATEKLIVYADHAGYLSIYSISGEKMLFEKSSLYNEVDISALPEGNYFVSVNTDYGSSAQIISIIH